MTIKGIAKALFFSTSKTRVSSTSLSMISSTSSLSIQSTPRHQFSESMMEENIDNAEAIIEKWNPNGSTYLKFTSLFLEHRKESKEFLRRVIDLRRAMHFILSGNSSSGKLVLAQTLMQMAMKRLEKEFYQILCASREQLDPESVSNRSSRASVKSTTTSDEDEDVTESDDEVRIARESITEVENVSTIAMADLKAIADCMISSGYGKECIKIYKIVRKSIIDEALHRLEIEKYSSSEINKMDWEVLDYKIKNWIDASKVAVKTLFNGERILCDHVFSSSDAIRESCFADIARDGAMNLFIFPEFISKSKKSSERVFRMLELYETMSDLWPEIESVFSFESTLSVRSQALSSMLKLGDAVRTIFSYLEYSIEKESSKTPVTGGGIHPLTVFITEFICKLSDYSGVLTDVIADWPTPDHAALPESYFDSPTYTDNPASAVTVRIAWLVLVLLCKIDRKAELYKDSALSYLFLANNLNFIIGKVQTTKLKFLLGDDWIAKHEIKVKQYASRYELLAWNKVLLALPENEEITSPETVKECFREFNAAFEEAYRKQSSWIVTEGRLRDEIKVAVARKLAAAYRAFYDTNIGALSGERNLEVLVRFAPDNLGNYLSDLFHGTDVSVHSSSSSSWSWSDSSRRR